MTQNPKYDNDVVNLGYLNKRLGQTEESINKNNSSISQLPKNYSIPPNPPYYKDSLLCYKNKIYKCNTTKLSGVFSWNDWTIAATDDTTLSDFINNTYELEKLEIQEQIDGKVQTYYQEMDPSNEWTTDLEKSKHIGDYWYNTTNNTQWRYNRNTTTTPITYGWGQVNVPNSVFDLIDKKKSIYTIKPTSYKKDDLWIIEDTLSDEDLPTGTEDNPIAKGDWVFSVADSDTYNKEHWIKRDEDISLSYLEQHYYTIGDIDSSFEELERNTDSKITKAKEEISLNVSQTYTTIEKYEATIYDFDEQIGTINKTITNHGTNISDLNIGVKKISASVESIETTTEKLSNDIDGVSADFKNFKDNEYIQSINNLQDQIDGAIQFWNGAEIPTLENYPANEWVTENDKINHQADIYTVIKDVQGEMKQGKSYRFDKINGVWQWIELTDNELSAVQAIAQEALDKSKLNATDISTIKNNVSKLEQTDREIKASVSSTENRVNILEETVEIYSIDLDLYNLTIPVNTENKPIETKLYEIGYYAYYKGKQVTPTIISKSTADGIDVSTTNGKIHLSVNQNNTISNINNELVFEFHYTVDGITNIISKKIIVVLAQQGPQGLQGPQGIQGIQGIQGVKGEDGISTYFYIRYSANANGSSMTTAPQSDTQYMGVASTTSPTAPTSSSGYTWSKIKGEQGEQGIPGQIGESGKTSYLHIKYSEDGTTFTPADSEYNIGEKPSRWQGTYVDFNENDSTIFSNYKWVDTAIVVEDLVTPTNTVSGPNIHIEDASDKKMVNFEIEGKSEQATRSGKNLLKIKNIFDRGLTTVVNNDGSITVSGTATATIAYIDTGENTNLEAGTYTFSIQDTLPLRFRLFLYNGSTQIFNQTITSRNKSISFTTTQSITSYSLIFLDLVVGNSYNFTIKPMLESGSTATEWEKYTGGQPSPSPDYPSEIESVGYENLVEETLTGMNINNSGQITRASFDMFIAKVEKDKTYTISVDDITGVVCGFFTSKPTLYSISYNNSRLIQESSMTIIAPITGYIAFRGTSGYQYAQLTEGTQAHSYIPYGKYGIEVENTGKNYFNAKIISDTNILVEDSGKTIKLPVVSSGNGYTSTGKKLKELCPNLKVGDTVFLNFNRNLGTNRNNFIYLDRTSTIWYIGTSKTITQEMLDSNFTMYGNRYQDGETTQCIITDFRITKNNDDTYEPHRSTSSLFVLNQPLRSLPNGVKDIAYIKNNILYVDRKVGSKIFDGNGAWYLYQKDDNAERRFGLYDNKVPQDLAMISNYFICDSRAIGQLTDLRFWTQDDYWAITDINSKWADATEFKNWLSTHNTQVDYELAEPYTEKIGEVEIPSTFKGVNNITTTDELEPVMNIEYVRDTILSDYVEGQVSNAVAIQERKNAEFQITNEEIKSTVSAISTNLDGTKSSLKSVEEKITSQEKTIKIISKNIDSTTGNITEVTTTNGFTFNSNGLKIYIDENSYNTVIDNVGTYYKDGDEVINQTTKDGSILTNLSEKGQTKYSYNENDDYDFIEERIESDGEYAYATFYNGEE